MCGICSLYTYVSVVYALCIRMYVWYVLFAYVCMCGMCSLYAYVCVVCALCIRMYVWYMLFVYICMCGTCSLYAYVSGVGGIDKYSTSVFLGKILRYNYIPTIGVADLQAPLNNMLQTS